VAFIRVTLPLNASYAGRRPVPLLRFKTGSAAILNPALKALTGADEGARYDVYLDLEAGQLGIEFGPEGEHVVAVNKSDTRLPAVRRILVANGFEVGVGPFPAIVREDAPRFAFDLSAWRRSPEAESAEPVKQEPKPVAEAPVAPMEPRRAAMPVPVERPASPPQSEGRVVPWRADYSPEVWVQAIRLFAGGCDVAHVVRECDLTQPQAQGIRGYYKSQIQLAAARSGVERDEYLGTLLRGAKARQALAEGAARG
jgi:hypothetical protein